MATLRRSARRASTGQPLGGIGSGLVGEPAPGLCGTSPAKHVGMRPSRGEGPLYRTGSAPPAREGVPADTGVRDLRGCRPGRRAGTGAGTRNTGPVEGEFMAGALDGVRVLDL